ncbi:MAG: MFS transporter [Oscillospiraceae bacterium]|nr:MFS transporter [Oscillospiraceae bacterium]
MSSSPSPGLRGAAILGGGAAIQILTGIPAAWGVFQPPVMAEYGFEEAEASLVLSCLVGAFGVGCVAGGFLQDQKGPRAAGLWGSALIFAGMLAAAFAPAGAPALFYLGFAAPVGLGTAFLYPAVMSCAQKWYAPRKGLATGVIGGAVGASGAFLSFFLRSTSSAWGIRASFLLLGSVSLLVCGGASFLLKDPPPPKPRPQDQGRKKVPVLALGPRQMLLQKNYWLCTASVCLATPTVLLFSPILLKMGQERGLSENAAVWAVVLGSLGSAAGRLAMPLISDKTGRRRADLALFAALALLSAGFAFARGWLWLACYALLTFCYSGQAALLPAFCTDLFGLAHSGVNYGFLALGMSAGSILFPLSARLLGLENGRHWLALGAAVLGFAAVWAIRPPAPKKPRPN